MNTKFLTPRLGGYAGILGSIEYAILWILAAWADGHWVLGQMTLSELGDRSRAGAVFFNTADILTGALALVFAIGLYRVLSTSPGGRLGPVLMGLASILLIGIGIFPIDTGTPHTVLSYSFFAVAALALFILIPPIWRSHVFHRRMGIITGILLSICLLGAVVLNVPSVEALAVGSLLLWMALMSVRMLWYHPST